MTYQTSKKKIWHSNGLEFYRVRSGFNEVAKLRFQHEPEPKSNNFKTIQHIGNSTESLKVSEGADGKIRGQRSLEKIQHKHVPEEEAENLVYTLVPLENLAAIEKEIKQCLLELVNVEP